MENGWRLHGVTMPTFQQSGKLDDKMLCMVYKLKGIQWGEGHENCLSSMVSGIYSSAWDLMCHSVWHVTCGMNSTEAPQTRQLVHQVNSVSITSGSWYNVWLISFQTVLLVWQPHIKYIMGMALHINYVAMECTCGVGYIALPRTTIGIQCITSTPLLSYNAWFGPSLNRGLILGVHCF